MNYVGSISIIDRGDAPAKAIIDKNTRSLAQRVADETKEELDKVMDRVDNIYVSYEMSTQTMFGDPRGSPNVEYIEDIKELEEIITDTVKKKKYQQQVTVFVVGFQDVCAQKMQLLQQVNQFFLDNSKLDEDELVEEKPEVDLEEASNKVNESLSNANELAKKLSDLNQDIIEWLVNYANTKASNKGGSGVVSYEKGKKRLEKNLESAKNELTDLAEKLLKLQTELEEKDEKFQQVAKQLEAKTQEAVRYKTAAEVAKKSAQENEAHTSVLQDEISRRDEKIVELRTKLSRLEINLTESQFDKEMSTRKLDNATAQTKEKLAKLQEEVETKKMAVGDAEREMEKLHRDQLTSLNRAHQQEIDELKKEHEEEIAKLTDEVLSLREEMKLTEQQALEANGQAEEIRSQLIELQLRENTKENIVNPCSRGSSPNSGKSIGELSASEDEHPSRQIGLYTLSPDESIRPLSSYSTKRTAAYLSESRQSTKETKKRAESLKPSKPPSKSPNRNIKDKSGRSTKDYADVSVQDEGGDVAKAYVEKSNEQSRQTTRQKNLETVIEGDGTEFPDAFDLDDEESWGSIPPQHIQGRFLQYRQLGRNKIKELEEQLQVTLTKTHRKVNSLKSQFNEHKSKWEAERKILIEQVEQAQKLQTDAEKEADAAMTQLEEFINEQEKLEDEEEQKRQDIIKTMSRPGTVKQTSPGPNDSKQEVKQEGQGEGLQTENSEQELKNLMQQTDDAKSRAGSSLSTGSPIAPWMTPANVKQEPAQKNIPKSHPHSEDLTSRQTLEADAEIQRILPLEDGSDDKASSVRVQEFPMVKGGVLPPIGLIKGEREKLMSRASSKSSMKPKLRSSSHLTEQEEEEDDEDIAPWLRNFGKSRAQTRSRSRSSEQSLLENPQRGSSELGKSSSSMTGERSIEPRKEESSSMRKSNSQVEDEGKDTSEIVSDIEQENVERKSISQENEKVDEREKENNATPWFHKVGKTKAERPEPSPTPVSRHADRSTSKVEIEQNQAKEEVNVETETNDPENTEKVRPKSAGRDAMPLGKNDNSKTSDGVQQAVEKVVKHEEKDKVKVEVKGKTSNNNQKLTSDKTSVNEEKIKARENKKAESKSKKRKEINADKRKIYEAYKKKRVEEINRKQNAEKEEVKKVGFVRRTSSAKIPKELQDRLNIEMEKRRQIRSSFGHVEEMTSPPISDIEDDDIELEPAFDDLQLVMNKEDHQDDDIEGQEDENVPELVSSMTVQPSVQSRLQNSRMTQQSLKSVSLAMELDLEDDMDIAVDENVFETEKQENSLEIQDIKLHAESVYDHNNNQGEMNESQSHTLKGQQEIQVQGHNELSGRESVQGIKSSVEEPVSESLEIIDQNKDGIADHSARINQHEGEPNVGKGQKSSSNEMNTNLSQGHEMSPHLDQDSESKVHDNESSLGRDQERKPNLVQDEESKPNLGERLESKPGSDQNHNKETVKQTRSKTESPVDDPQDIRSLMLESNRGIMTDEEKAVYSRMTSIQETPRLTASVMVLHTPGEESLMASPADLQARKNARHTGAISAPPAVEPDDAHAQKSHRFEIVEEDFESKPVTSREKKSLSQSKINLDQEKPVSPPKEAFRTPRTSRPRSLHSEASIDSMSTDTDIDEGVAMDLPPSQSEALSNLKSMMAEDNLTLEQQKTLESLRSAIRTLSREQALRDVQLERTVTILSLASQIAQESVELGVLPDSVFDSFSKVGSRAISAVSGQRSLKGSAGSRLKYSPEKEEKEIPPVKSEKEIEFKLVKQKKPKHSKAQKADKPHKSLPSMPQTETKLFTVDKDVKKEKKVIESEREYSHSSGMADFLSSRGDSFSASLPRTLTSSEWRRLSPHDPFSPNIEKKPIKEVKQEVRKEKNIKPKNTLPAELQSKEMIMSPISVVISPKKKSRPVTMQQMLYGEEERQVQQEELKAAIDKLNNNAKLVLKAGSITGSSEKSKSSSKKGYHSPNDHSVIDNDNDSLISLENNASSLSETQTDQSDQALQTLQEEIVTPSENVETFSDHLAQLPSVPDLAKVETFSDHLAPLPSVPDIDEIETFSNNRAQSPTVPDNAKVTKFEVVSKVLTFEIETERKSRPRIKNKISKNVIQQPDLDILNEDPNFYNLESYSLTGNNCNLEDKDFEKIRSRRNASRSRSFAGFAKSRSRSSSYMLAESLPVKGSSLSNRLSSLANKNKYSVSFSEFADKPIFNDTSKMHPQTEKPPKENLFPRNWRLKNDSVAMTTMKTKHDLETFEVKEIFCEELESEKEAVLEEAKSAKCSSLSTSSPASRIQPRHSAKSKSSAHSELQHPKSPSTIGRVSPDTINRASPVAINRSPRTTATPGTMVSEVQRPVSISSVQPRICDSPLPIMPKTPPPHLHKETQTDDLLAQIEHEPVTGHTEDEVRQSSAKSRASLRSQFKSRLDETRQAVEDRRTKSPVINVPPHKSIDDELIIDDDDDLPIPDDLKEEVFMREDTLDAGTSPPPSKQDVSRKISVASRKSTNLAEHPLVSEYLRAYTGIHNFKEAMSRVLVDKDQMSASQILTDLDILQFNKDDKVVPQISNMTENIYYVLNEVSQVINSVLQNDRGPVVSSLMMGMSRDATQRTIMREKSGVTGDMLETRGSQRTVSTKAGSVSTEAAQYQDLQAQYEKLQNEMSEDSKKYEEQQKHNVVVMMEMQDTINQLQRELSALGKQTRRPVSASVSTAGVQNGDSAIMFTRLDSERNAKIMKKAVNERKLDANRYKDAMVQMDEYVNLPAQRLAHLVRKYVHHCRMKDIEENVQKSQSLNENVFELFDKMEALQNQRAKRWADRMDEMGTERYRLANMLMETLDSIEQESGLFLIKPMYSYRGREPKEQVYSGKITRPFRPHRTLSPLRDNTSAHAPAPTPASNIRPRNLARRDDQYSNQNVGQGHYEVKGPLEGDSTGIMGSSVGYMASQPGATWRMADSQQGINNPHLGNVNTPRILELDINRMMIGQNTISAQIGSQGLSNDRLVNAANNNLRAYMTVNRPGPNSAGKADRPHSGSRQTTRPSSSPTNGSASTAKRVRLSDVEVPTLMSQSQPLPPIGVYQDTPRNGSSLQSPARIPVGDDLPESPPGSSLRHSPVGMEDNEEK